METTIIGTSRNIETVRVLIKQVAETEVNTIVCGETGVGKELVVQNLCRKSRRFGKPFVKVNCAAIPDNLLESELFGYEPGAFTGADRRKRGKFELANGGVLFLDEICDMPLLLQPKILHVLQDGYFTPLGSEEAVKVDIWVIAATNRDLKEALKSGDFRQDLFYRLSTIVIYVDPLRKRPEDIPLLLDYYIRKYSSKFNGRQPANLKPSTIDKLRNYHWPGNVRELQNVIKRLIILSDREENIAEIMRSDAAWHADTDTQTPLKKTATQIEFSGLNDMMPMYFSSFGLKDVRKKVIDRVEKEVISYVLGRTYWNRAKAARILQISYKTLLYKINDLKIEIPLLSK